MCLCLPATEYDLLKGRINGFVVVVCGAQSIFGAQLVLLLLAIRNNINNLPQVLEQF